MALWDKRVIGIRASDKKGHIMKIYIVTLRVPRTEEKRISAPDDSTEEEVRQYAEAEYYEAEVLSVKEEEKRSGSLIKER